MKASDHFFAALRARDSGLFGTSLTQAQVDGINAILAASEGLPVSHRAYLLATAYHETGRRMQPVREAFGASDDDTIRRLDAAWKAGKMPQVKAPYWRRDAEGRAWYGRGYVQITHKGNYAKAGKLIGKDLIRTPDLALAPDIAAEILVKGCDLGIFTGQKLADFLPGDYVAARRVVNGTDRAELIAGYARSFERALRAAGVSKAPTKPGPAITAPAAGIGAAITLVAAAVAHWWAEVEAFIRHIFGG